MRLPVFTLQEDQKELIKGDGREGWSKGPFPHISKEGIIKNIEKIRDTNIRLHNYNYYAGV